MVLPVTFEIPVVAVIDIPQTELLAPVPVFAPACERFLMVLLVTVVVPLLTNIPLVNPTVEVPL